MHYTIPQRRTVTCPERGSARGKSGLRNSERLSPSQTCPRQSVPQKGKPHCQSVSQKGKPHCQSVSQKGKPHCQSVSQKGKEPHCQSVPQKGKPAHAKVSPLERKRPPPGASVRRPTLYNIWYNFLIIFINNTITCIL